MLTNTCNITVAANADLIVDANGTLNNSGTITVTGTAEIDSKTVTKSTAIEVTCTGTLTIDTDSTVNNAFFSISVGALRTLHSFPTRRSSDLVTVVKTGADLGILNLQGDAVLASGTLTN